MTNWYILSLIILVFQGIIGFLSKVSAEKKCNTIIVNFFWATTVVFWSAIFLFFKGFHVPDYKYLLTFCFLGGVSYSTATILKVESLKHMDASVAFPLFRFSGVLVVLFSFIYFKDALSLKQLAGMFVALAVVFLISQDSKAKNRVDHNFKLGFILIFSSIIFAAVASIIPKFAAVQFDSLAFIFFTYIFNALFSLFLSKRMKSVKKREYKEEFKIGFLIGSLNFVGFYLLLQALAIGPLSIIYIIQSLSFLLTIILAVIFYKERITLKRFVGIVLAIASVVLMQ